MLATLDHPNVVTPHSPEKAEGVSFLTSVVWALGDEPRCQELAGRPSLTPPASAPRL